MATRQGATVAPVIASAVTPNVVSEAPREAAVAALAKALGHPARIGIVSILHEGQGCIGCNIVKKIGLAQSTTSEHLRSARGHAPAGPRFVSTILEIWHCLGIAICFMLPNQERRAEAPRGPGG